MIKLIPLYIIAKNDTNVDLSLLSSSNEEKYTFNDTSHITFKFDLFKGDNKLTFKTNKPLVFTYSNYEEIDKELFKDNSEFYSERKVMTDFKIVEITDKNNNDNIIKINLRQIIEILQLDILFSLLQKIIIILSIHSKMPVMLLVYSIKNLKGLKVKLFIIPNPHLILIIFKL